MDLDPKRIDDTKAWFTKAVIDIRSAEADLSANPPVLEDVLFHSQQIIEKALKGFLTWHSLAFPKTHNLVDLGKRCVSIDATLEPLLSKAGFLTQYAWIFRYPGIPQNPEADEAQNGLNLALEVVESILSRLSPEVRPQLKSS